MSHGLPRSLEGLYERVEALEEGGGETPTVAWDDVTDKPSTFPATVPVATATALATGRTIALTGGATGTSAAFTGAANASIAVTLATPTASVRGGVLLQNIDSGTADLAAVIAALVAAGILNDTAG